MAIRYQAVASSRQSLPRWSAARISRFVAGTIVIILLHVYLLFHTPTSLLRLISRCLPLVSPLKRPPHAAAFASQCKWQLASPAHVCTADSEAASINFDMYASFVRGCLRRAHVHACHSTRDSTRALLVGPLISTPGLWHSFAVDYSHLIRPEDRIVSVIADAVNATSGLALTYPPLHIHHIHVAYGASRHWHETHGDYTREDEHGYVRRIPPGYCEIAPPTYSSAAVDRFLTSQINDVRFTTDASMSLATADNNGIHLAEAERAKHGLPFFLRLVFRLAPAATTCRPSTKFILWYPFPPEAVGERLTRYNVRTTDSIWWWALRVPRRLRILPPAWLHAHRARYAGLLLVRGNHTPRTLGACASKEMPPQASIKRGQSSTDLSAGLLQARHCLLHAAIRSDGLVCADEESTKPSYARIPQSADGAIGGLYDRQGSLHCEPRVLEEGEILTVFSLSAARWRAEIDPFPQHMMLFFFADTNASYTELIEVLPPTYGSWELGGGNGSYVEGLISGTALNRASNPRSNRTSQKSKLGL